MPLSNEEVICTFMEPKPRFTEVPDVSVGRWWVWFADANEPIALTLDRLHLVEARLTNQWGSYVNEMLKDNPSVWTEAKLLLHATAEQKIRALASVLRPLVEKSDAALAALRGDSRGNI